ncbi:hypothetical protein KCP76_05495 [Salmonella enterica subsp. enterica serovar Weltevreden]|nr:hypothetical protein KCP76_05495 [Salmonella enterica subsp. enterica serovar Weltevreden]
MTGSADFTLRRLAVPLIARNFLRQHGASPMNKHSLILSSLSPDCVRFAPSFLSSPLCGEGSASLQVNSKIRNSLFYRCLAVGARYPV